MVIPQKMKQNYHMIQQSTSGFISKRSESRNLKKYWYTHVHSSIIRNSQQAEATQVSIDGGMSKQNVFCTCNEILFSLKKQEVLIHAAILMKLEDHYAQ